MLFTLKRTFETRKKKKLYVLRQQLFPSIVCVLFREDAKTNDNTV